MSKEYKAYRQNIKAKIIETRNILRNKYFELFMNQGRCEGDCTDEDSWYVNYKFYEDGSVAVWNMAGMNIPGFASFAVQEYDYRMKFPRIVRLINESGASSEVIPNKPLEVNKDVVVIYYSPNRLPAKNIINYYIDRIVQVEMIINTNLNIQKMPFVIKGNNLNKDKIRDLMDKILNDEIVIGVDVNEKELIENLEVLQTGAPFIVDKLYAYEKGITNELLTYMGFNNISYEKKERLITDEANANNDFIEMSDDAHTDEIQRGFERVKKYLGFNIRYISKFDEIEQRDVQNSENEGGDENVEL